MSNFTPILLYRSSRFTASLRRSGYLLALVVAYLLAGALVLQTLEYDARAEVVEEALDTVEHERQNVLDVSRRTHIAQYVCAHRCYGRIRTRTRRPIGCRWRTPNWTCTNDK